jgi:hypothetical protein
LALFPKATHRPMQTNVLDYGDNLDILRRYLPDAFAGTR